MLQRLWPALLAAAMTIGCVEGAGAEAVLVVAETARPDGSTVSVSAVELMGDGIVVHVAVTTGANPVELNGGGVLVLRDDLGMERRLSPPADNPSLAVAANSRFEGELDFLGRLTPGARQLTLAASGADGGGLDLAIPLPGETMLQPDMGAAPPPPAAQGGGPTIAGEAIARAPLLIPTDAKQRHANGAVLEIRALAVEPQGIIALLTVTNIQPRPIRLNAAGSLRLIDDSGAVYPVVPPAGNEEIALPGQSRLDANLVFAGRLAPGVHHLTLTANAVAGGSRDDPASWTPVFEIPLTIATERLGVPLPPAAPAAPAPTAPAPAPARGAMLAPAVRSTGPVFAATIIGAERSDWVPVIRSGELRPAGLRLTALPVPAIRGPAVTAAPIAPRPPLAAAPIAQGTVVRLPGDLLFDYDSTAIRPSAQPLLEQVAAVIRKAPGARVEVVGHTDSSGNRLYSHDLSEDRAEAVARWLAREEVVPEDRLTARGHGEARPVVPNQAADGSDSPKGRALNRRVEVVIRKDPMLQVVENPGD